MQMLSLKTQELSPSSVRCAPLGSFLLQLGPRITLSSTAESCSYPFIKLAVTDIRSANERGRL